MKKVLFAVAAVAAFFLGTAAFASGSCPPGMACSEHYTMPIAQTATFNNDSSAKSEKREQLKKEREKLEEAFEAASYRDNDLEIKKISLRSFYCNWADTTTMYEKWLVENPDVVVDRKEHMESWTTKKATEISHKLYLDQECTASIMVHYHKDEQLAEITGKPNMIMVEVFASEEFSATRKKRSAARDAAMVKALDWISTSVDSNKEDSARFVQETSYNRKTKKWTSDVTVIYRKKMLTEKK